MQNMTFLLKALSLTSLLSMTALGQGPATVHLVIDSANTVFYVDDVTNFATLATSSTAVLPETARNFTRSINIGDIVSVNGNPARGTATGEFSTLTMRTNPAPGQAIADIPSGTIARWTYTILSAGGEPVGSILIQGLGFAPKAPGSPAAALAGDFAVIGGTGAFAGARGQASFAPLTPPGRFASDAEDPANRRALGGGSYRLFVDLIRGNDTTIDAR